MPDSIEQVFALEGEREVNCYYCDGRGVPSHYGDVDGYRRGEAVLAGPGHSPYNAEANYICLAHTEHNVVIIDPANGFKQISLADYAKLGRPEVTGDMYLRV